MAIIVSRFVTGSAQSFNQQTNVDLSNKYIVLDLSELKGKLLPVGMMIALDYVWDNVKADRTKKKAIMIDEIWQLVGALSNRQAADFCLTIFKTIRGFGGAAISATQDLSDFFGLEDGKYGRAIINNSKNKIILNLEPDEARYVQEVLKLTKTETRSITRFERGQIEDISGDYYVGLDSMCKPDQRTVLAVWVLLKFIDQVGPMDHYTTVYPSQLFILKEDIGYEIVVLYKGEQSQLRLLQPQEDLKYIIVLPHIAMAEGLRLPRAPCLFATVEFQGKEEPEVNFYQEEKINEHIF